MTKTRVLQGSSVLVCVTRIALDHILFASRNPDKLAEIASRLGCSADAALAYAIADHVCEEFNVTKRQE